MPKQQSDTNKSDTTEYSLIEYSAESLKAYLKSLPTTDPKVDVVKAMIKSIKD